MIRTLECPNCGQLNDVDTQKFAQALCGSCKGKFSSLTALGAYKSSNELASALEIDTEYSESEKLMLNRGHQKLVELKSKKSM